MKFAELKDYEGVDADLETSLFEYGMVWHKEKDGAYKFIYGVVMDATDTGEFVFTHFDWAIMDAVDFKELVNEDWFETDGGVQFCDLSGKDELITNFPYSVYDAVQYHGVENIFGSSYYPFTIEEVPE